jgi:hypothetical protein
MIHTGLDIVRWGERRKIIEEYNERTFCMIFINIR